MRRECEVEAHEDQREVAYCGFCGVYMCSECRRDPVKRAKAMLRKYVPWNRKAA